MWACAHGGWGWAEASQEHALGGGGPVGTGGSPCLWPSEALMQSPSSLLAPGCIANPGTGCPHSPRRAPIFPFPERWVQVEGSRRITSPIYYQ